MSDVPPHQAVAAFDSASALLGALAAALRGQPFSHLGNGRLRAAGVRAAGRLPWPLLRGVYTRAGAAEALPAKRLGDIDLDWVAGWLAGQYPDRPYPGVLIGSSNGALTHLAAAAGVPWLPTTLLVPVAHRGDPDRPDDALRFGRRVAGPLLERNPEVVLHQMHDQLQDRLMVARMAYFRVKWRELPVAYRRFLDRRLAPGAPVVLIEDGSTWPVTRLAERHVFQAGAQGGRDPDWYHGRPHTPTPDGEAAEAEWGLDRRIFSEVSAWCATADRPLVRLRYDGPQRPAHAVATALRGWYRQRGEPGDRLVVPSFVVGDPWSVLRAAAVPFWTFFPVRAALAAYEQHLDAADAYEDVDILLFNHGAHSDGVPAAQEWLDVARQHGARARLVGLRRDRFPADIASLARYGPALAALPAGTRPWSPFPTQALDALSAALEAQSPLSS